MTMAMISPTTTLSTLPLGILKSSGSTNKDSAKEELKLKLRLQAAERYVLYLERIAPHRIVMRLNKKGMSAKMLQSEMLRAIREEFDHNLSQQIYVSPVAWKLIKNAKEEMVKLINISSEKMDDGASSFELGKRIFEVASQVEKLPSEIAMDYLKEEIQREIIPVAPRR